MKENKKGGGKEDTILKKKNKSKIDRNCKEI